MAKKKIVRDPFSEETVKKERTFPVKYTVILCLLIALQVLFVILACLADANPQDVIKSYSIEVEPRDDGSLDLYYTFVWNALDESEELTWVEIGTPNGNYSVLPGSLSPEIQSVERYSSDGYTSLRVHFKRAYQGGETLTFSFGINQRRMLCEDEYGRFYELVPGWFNATPVEHYRFLWRGDDAIFHSNGTKTEEGYVWEGEMDCGTYVNMKVHYPSDAFPSATPVKYQPFDDSGVWNDLQGERAAKIFFLVLLILLLAFFELCIVDGYVSYHRGRGFLRGYGHHVHVYGRVNPHYTRARDRANAASTRGGGGGGRGCACACACACAGGGRAGCSQKNTYQIRDAKEERNE